MVEEKILSRIPFQIMDKDTTINKTFMSAVHYKEQCKVGQQVESIFIFSY